MSRLKRLLHQSSSATIVDNNFGYNTANQISQIAELGQTRNLGYDSVDRLTSMTNGTSNESYAFDAVGNRTSSHRSASYSYQPFNRMTTTATAALGHDANGNMTTKGEGSNLWRYTWDYENRMTMAATRKDRVRYKFDALGRRVQRIARAENTKFIHDGEDVLVDDNAGTLTKYLNGEGIDNKLRVQTGTSVNYFLADHLGSTNGLADPSGAITSQTAYDSFGNQTASLTTRYGFTGRERDDLSGLMYYRARFYDPKLGRFVSEDPIGFGGGDINLYSYVGNNPLRWRDALGLSMMYPAGWGNVGPPTTWADWLDDRFKTAHDFYGYDPWIGINLPTGEPQTFFGSLYACSNMLRVGDGFGHALYAPDENGWGRAAFVAMDVERFSGLFTAMAGTLAGRVGGATRTLHPNPAADWLGQGSRTITNPAGDKVFLSADATRRIRFDFNRPSPHTNPHMHVEEYINGRWVKSGPIYPQGVPNY